MDLQLAGKAAIVTGGSRGIGKAVAHVLAAEGVDVALVARASETVEAAAAEIRQASGRNVVAISADTAHEDQIKAAVASAAEALGRIDILVNSAATPGGNRARLPELDDAAFYPDVNVKVLGYLRFIREVAPHMQRHGWGRIVNISGMAGRQASGIMSSVRNAAVVAMSKAVAEQLGPDGITVNTVHPAAVRTERSIAQIRELAESEGLTFEAAEQRRLGDGNLLRRPIDASDIACVIAFLASPRGVAVNGETIAVTGGTPGWISY
ncbi:MAG: SDR family NAD(P)-dependent oxidoreductase [Chloroflexi bacterium]|nr:SDR family NAD(P)-dependent oxidoreductase [Chloroflexota bacterium]